MSFLEKTITTNSCLFRSSLLLLISVIIIYFLVTILSFKLDKIDLKEKSVQLSFRQNLNTQYLNIINVPACQLLTPTGVKLDKDYDIEISASGAVSTGGFGDLPDGILAKEKSELDKRVLQIELDRGLNRGWRDPNGNLIYIENTLNKHSKQSDASDELKIIKSENYGTLIGIVFNKNSINLDNMLAQHKIIAFKIGDKCNIKFDKSFTIDTSSIIIPAEYDQQQIYLTVNDTVITKEDDLNIISDKTIRHIQHQVYKTMTRKEGIWYTDNLGNFIVNMKRTKHGIF